MNQTSEAKQAVREMKAKRALDAAKKEKRDLMRAAQVIRRKIDRVDAKCAKARADYHLEVFGTDWRGRTNQNHPDQKPTPKRRSRKK
jgi:hypothetical protein